MTERQLSKRPPIAVVGVSALFPGSSDAQGFWRDILAAKDLLTTVPESHWLVEDFYDPDPTAPDKTYANRGGFLGKVDFDAIGWGIPPSIIPATDTSQLLALIVAEQVLRDAAGDQFATMDRSRISCILGVTSAQELLATMVSRLQRPIWVKSLREHGVPEEEVQQICQRIGDHYQPWQESSFPGLLGNVVAGRIANRLDLGGTNCVTDAACASTFSAVQMAVQELYLGDSDMVIAGGVDTLNDIFMYMCFSKTPALSPSGDCRPFSDQADGTMLGEGLGMVALKRLDDAQRDGDRIYGVLRGVGASSDGRSKSVYAPVSEGQAKALSRAYEHANYSPRSVELVEAHGTGTKAGDVAEFNGLKMVFKKDDDHKQWCAIGSVKSQIGHTKAAAGAAGLFKAVMALHHKVLPPTAKVDKLNDKLEITDSAFYVNTSSRPWIRGSDHPRRASVSAFGFGGSNFHLTLEEFTGANRHARQRTMPVELVTLSATDGAALAKAATDLNARTKSLSSLERLAWDSQHSFDASAPARLALVASDKADLAKKLERAAGMLQKNPTAGFETPDGTVVSFAKIEGDAAFMFPGQGSQYVNMGADLAMAFDRAIAPWDASADMSFGGQNLHEIVFPISRFSDEDREADENTLRATEWAQPGIGCTSLSALQMMNALGVKPAAFAGHSFGEVTALHAAGVLSEQDMLLVARKRGELMAAAAEVPGAMTAVSATIDIVESVLKDLNDPNVVVANHNAPDQVVISGTVDGVKSAEAQFTAKGVTFKPLAVSTAFHSPVVSASVKPFSAFLDEVAFKKANLPVWSGESAAAYEADAKSMRDRLGRQIANPVRFVQLVENMYANGVRVFIEVGPGSVLTKLAGQILGDRPHIAVSTDRRSKNGIESFFRALASLSAAGVKLDLDAIWEGYAEPVDVAAMPKPKLAIGINGANHDKAYPPQGGAAALPKPNPPRPVAPAIAAAPAAPAPAPKAASVNAPAARAPMAAQAPVAPLSQAVQAIAPAQAQQFAPQMQSNHSPEWLATWQEAQKQNAMALMAFQHAMSQSQSSFMQTIQSSFAALGGTQQNGFAAQPQQFAQAPQFAQPQAFAQAPQFVQTQPQQAAQPFTLPTTASVIPTSVGSHVAPAALAAPAIRANAPKGDVNAAMLQTVSEKTGYPMEMLDLTMDLENDLGVDSIKRVEILAAVQERVPGLPAVDATTMASLRTLGEIVTYMQSLMGGAAIGTRVSDPLATGARVSDPHATGARVSDPHATGARVSDPHAIGATATAAPAVDLHALMFAAVAEKTGYPAEMLELSMDLEGDLGIDSIKRVEILAAVQEQAPGMPDVDTNKMAALKTLEEIVVYMQGLMGSATGARVSDPHATGARVSDPHAIPATPATAAPAVDLHALMFAAVSEKTGYPSDMLELSMDLEGDLGIDSIKRVEILAAVQEQAPGMPDVDTNRMASLKTLEEIVVYMQGLMGSVAPAASKPTSAPAHTAPAAPAVDLHALMFAAVSEKTGYPSDMLELSMDLEGDLGIDSIKRVEILAAVQEQAPGMPDVDTNKMAALKTLEEIVNYMQGLMGGTPASTQADAGKMPAHQVAKGSTNLGRFALTLAESPALGLAPRGLSAIDFTVTGESAVGNALVAALKDRGVTAHYSDKVQAGAKGVIYLGGLSHTSNDDDAIAINREAFRVARTIAPTLSKDGGVFITVQDTGGGFGLTPVPSNRAWIGGLSGLVKTADQEWADATLKAIDIERGTRSVNEIAIAIADEITLGGADIEVGLMANGKRFCPKSVETSVETGNVVIGEDDVIVVSGGARGVTATCVIEWARRSKAKFVLLGRSALEPEPANCRNAHTDAALKQVMLADAKAAGEKITPAILSKRVSKILAGRDIRATLAAIDGAGGKATYVAASVTDASSLENAFNEVRAAWGPITGIVHGAGVLADKYIVDQSDADFDFVFDTKIEGLRALLTATDLDPLKVVCVFSSVAARCGNNGQANYAMANEVLNKVATSMAQSKPGLLVKSLGWGPWEGGMVSPELKAHFDRLGVAMIPLHEGAIMFADEMESSQRDQIELVLGGEPRAAALMSDDLGKPLALEVRVSSKTHAFLEGHSIAGAPVVPVVLVLEWFSRIASSYRRDLHLSVIKDLKVLKGMRLDQFNSDGDLFVVTCAPVKNGSDLTLQLELRAADGTPHYRAQASMKQTQDADANSTPAKTTLQSWKDHPIYGDVLFHTNDFQVLLDVNSVGPDGIEGDTKGVRQASWTWDHWQTDVAALDGGLQMLLLWAREELGGSAIPMAIGEFRLSSKPPSEGRVRCLAHCTASGTSKATADVLFIDEAGVQLAEMKHVELIMRPRS